MTLTVKNLHW